MRKSDKKKNLFKANLLAEGRYLESKGLITEETYGDVFQFLSQDPQNMSMGSIYYGNVLKMNKTLPNDGGEKIANPVFGKIFKSTLYRFQWANTWEKSMEKIDPSYVVGSGERKGPDYQKVEGYNVLLELRGTLYIPIIPTGIESKFHLVDEDGVLNEISKEEVDAYIKATKRPPKVLDTVAPDGGAPPVIDRGEFRNIKLDNIFIIKGGGNIWKNDKFNGHYMGPMDSV